MRPEGDPYVELECLAKSKLNNRSHPTFFLLPPGDYGIWIDFQVSTPVNDQNVGEESHKSRSPTEQNPFQ